MEIFEENRLYCQLFLNLKNGKIFKEWTLYHTFPKNLEYEKWTLYPTFPKFKKWRI